MGLKQLLMAGLFLAVELEGLGQFDGQLAIYCIVAARAATDDRVLAVVEIREAIGHFDTGMTQLGA